MHGILEQWEDFAHLEAIEYFLAKLEAAVQAIYVNLAAPFPNFFAAAHPAYLEVILSVGSIL